MIAQDRNTAALKVIQKLIIHTRKMAYEREKHEKIAALLDDIEYLPGLLIDTNDQTTAFRNYISDITKQYKLPGILDIFDS
jgi:hypothetical protein